MSATYTEGLVTEALRLVLAAEDAGAAEVDVELLNENVKGYSRPTSARVRVTWQRDTAPVVETGGEAAHVAAEPRDRLPWDHYAVELRDALKDLARQYPADMVADAAYRLDELVRVHGRPRPAEAAS
jgi:hypothetical protein